MAVKMIEKYQRMLETGRYDSEEEMCNELGLNYSDIYYEESDEEKAAAAARRRGGYRRGRY